MENNEVKESILRNAKVTEYKNSLKELRKNGVVLLDQKLEELNAVKKDKILTSLEKQDKIISIKADIQKAKADMTAHKEEIKNLEKEAVAYVKSVSSTLEKEASEHAKEVKIKATEEHKNSVARIKGKYFSLKEEINKKYEGKEKDEVAIKEKKVELRDAKLAYTSTLNDERLHFENCVQSAKDEANERFQTRRSVVRELRNGHESFAEKQEAKWQARIYNFKLSKFFLNNALYLTILVVFIACFIIAPIQGYGNILTWGNIFEIIEQSSTKIFYALGVAGLILLAGTDLSVGRMVALGAVTTSVILHDGVNIIQFFGLPALDFSGVPMAIRVILALLLSVLLCTLFSGIAGFFTAKFKMHPFITTLSTELVIFGLLYYATTGISAGGVEAGVRDLIGGRITIGDANFPKIAIYAAIAVVVVWFIWNKTKFGKNIYAVGGNAEAAAVSGISVFWTTLGVFLMAGVLYGCGSFLEAFRSNANASTGAGWEMDAIAACVVGGISFNGGVGKIKGAVIGVFIFQTLTYLLTALNIDKNLQFVFQGIIIMSAVALDSVKYLKKK